MRRLPMLLTACACALAALLAGGALAATKQRAAAPRVVTVKPLRVGIGDTLTIRGTGFLPGKLRNWVVFQRDRARPVFARADISSRSVLRIKLPEKLRPFLSLRAGKPIPTRFRLRVLSATFGKDFTAKKLSPVIGPTPTGTTSPPPEIQGDCDKDGIKNSVDTDDDNDLLTDTEEKQFKTNPCSADSDGDGVEDYFEVESAKDLNIKANFPPVKRPYPNPNFADANVDYDGDGLTNNDEYLAWVRYGNRAKSLNYSDGCQDTGAGGCLDGSPGAGGATGPVADARAWWQARSWLDINRNGQVSDDEKDVDKDGLSNWDEAHGRLTYKWWQDWFKGEVGYQPQFGDLDWLDPDTDGDKVADGSDDQDYDDLDNAEELGGRVRADVPQRGPYWMQPYNPCLPSPSARACSKHPPSDNSWPPFDSSTSPLTHATGLVDGVPVEDCVLLTRGSRLRWNNAQAPPYGSPALPLAGEPCAPPGP